MAAMPFPSYSVMFRIVGGLVCLSSPEGICANECLCRSKVSIKTNCDLMCVRRYEIKMLVMDVDGTLTDGKIYMGEHGEVCKAFGIKDGYGIHDILIPVILTGRKSPIVENRCRELGITEIHQGVQDKPVKLSEVSERVGVSIGEIAYIGDDLNDIECMKIVKNAGGFVGCPANAAKEVRRLADYLSDVNGGNGAVREFIEWIVSQCH